MIYEISTTSIASLATTLPAHAPVCMLNLLRFRPNGGRDRYFGDYVAAFRAIMRDKGIDGIAPVWSGSVVGMVAGPDGEKWDAVLIVRYPSLAAFRAIVESDAYRDNAAPHRIGALIDWRLIAQTEVPLPA